MTEQRIIVTFTINRAYPTPDVPRHRFDKNLEESPWSGAVEGSIYLDDPVWELLGYPVALRVEVAGL